MLRRARGGSAARRGAARQALVLRARPARDRQVEPAAARGAHAARGRHAWSRTSICARIAEQLGDDAPDGWLRRVAERVAAELELGVDVGRVVGRARRRRRESARRVLLGSRADEHDRARSSCSSTTSTRRWTLPFAADLLDAVGGCYARRSREPDFARLAFALAGCASQRELARASPDSAFAEAEIIEPEDFDAEQSYRLAVAFGGDKSSRRR